MWLDKILVNDIHIAKFAKVSPSIILCCAIGMSVSHKHVHTHSYTTQLPTHNADG